VKTASLETDAAVPMCARLVQVVVQRDMLDVAKGNAQMTKPGKMRKMAKKAAKKAKKAAKKGKKFDVKVDRSDIPLSPALST